ncbi:hypothetical protein C0993_003623 [Termitomyces sp. T159_Od127]|nr:hypothetical protein C0993_003623 [Termitomyces sp. T159_Od127]
MCTGIWTCLSVTCHDPLPTPGTPALPKPPPQLPRAQTATRPTPPAITAHQRHSHRHLQHLPAITTVTATSALGLGYHVTSALAPPVTPDPRRDPPSRIMIAHHCRRPPLATPRSRSLLTALSGSADLRGSVYWANPPCGYPPCTNTEHRG